ncbi:MAG: carbamoyl phosphate synthase small subunit [Candidatus Omnitrophota bacterium]
MKAILMLENGRSFTGETNSAVSTKIGKVNFDTRVVGYQEAITDTANAGRILVLTYPLIGNYGVAAKFNESDRAWPCALIIKEKSAVFSNWQAEESLDKWAKRHKLPIVYGIDTRTLAVHLRQEGEMLGVVSSSIFAPKRLLKYIKDNREDVMRRNWLEKTSVKEIKYSGKKTGPKIVVVDLGISRNILRQLENLRLNVALVPFNTDSADILKLKPKALIISNGPEHSSGLSLVASTVKALLGKAPILGISTGAQVLALSLGAKIKKMHIGHHGLNYPIKPAGSLCGSITVQSHSRIIDAKSLNRHKDIKITAFNLNDNSVEEFESRKLKILGVQYYPLSPGCGQMHPVIDRFIRCRLS